MSPSAWRGVRLGLTLFVAALAQSLYADAMRIGAAHPDLLLLVALVGSLFCDVNGSAALGFIGGLLYAAKAAPPHGGFGSLIVSRTLVCAGVGWLEERVFRDNPFFAIVLTGVGTALAGVLFALFAPQAAAPQHNVLLWARNLSLTTLYNTVLALPCYLLLRKLLRFRRADRP
jgi:cell shape-determining protein MreD